jgi:hypothetical protein
MAKCNGCKQEKPPEELSRLPDVAYPNDEGEKYICEPCASELWDGLRRTFGARKPEGGQ